MSENNNKVVKLQGSIDLAALAGVQFLRIGLNKVPMICIPVKDNPSIFVPETKEGQRRKALRRGYHPDSQVEVQHAHGQGHCGQGKPRKVRTRP